MSVALQSLLYFLLMSAQKITRRPLVRGCGNLAGKSAGELSIQTVSPLADEAILKLNVRTFDQDVRAVIRMAPGHPQL